MYVVTFEIRAPSIDTNVACKSVSNAEQTDVLWPEYYCHFHSPSGIVAKGEMRILNFEAAGNSPSATLAKDAKLCHASACASAP